MDGIDNITLGQLSKALAGLSLKATGTPNAGPDLYADGGLFARCDANGTLINALVGSSGFEKSLRWIGTDVTHEIIEMLTYVDSSGFAQSTTCGDCGKPQYKICRQTSCFARLCQSTNEFLADEMGLKKGPRAPVRTLFGNMTAPDGTVIYPMGASITDKFLMEVAFAGYNLRQRVHYEMWNGTGGTAGGYTSMTSIPMFVNTGYGDVLTWNTPCTGLDSTLISYGNNIVGGVNSPNIYQYIASVIRRLAFRARAGGFDWNSAEHYIVMSHQLSDCVYDAFACAYGQVCTQNASTGVPSQVTINNALDVRGMIDRMRADGTLRIDGRDYPVVIDDQIPYINTSQGNTTVNCSDIYFITTAINGRDVFYGQYQDFDKTWANERAWMQQHFGAVLPNTTDGGRFLIWQTVSGGLCFDARMLVKPRIVVEMPWLSGRLTNVCCAPTGGVSYPDQTSGDGLYTVDGGVHNNPVESLYGPCAQQTGSYGTSYYSR